ncbi:MAG: membrane protein insertase YidC [Desulfobacterales bacterium]|jgi:YidC/Oxa1 family membrane protein insertase|nr:membrane protein insertase YidC [Desulfobacterales bacterium]
MEQWRLFLAIFLSILVFAVWQYFFVPKQEVETPPSPVERAKEAIEPAILASDSVTPETEKVAGEIFEAKTIHTSLYTARISAKGAALTGFVLEKYKETFDDQNVGKQLIPPANTEGTILVELDGKDAPDLSHILFTSDYSEEVMDVSAGARSMSFYSQSDTGYVVEKKYTFYPDSYKIDLEVTVKNESAGTHVGSLAVILTNPTPETQSSYGFEGPFAYINNSFEQIEIKEFEKKGVVTGNVDWAGIETQYFMTTIIPDILAGNLLRFHFDSKNNLVEVRLSRHEQIFQPGAAQSGKYTLFFGPKRMSDLKSVGRNLDKAVNFGYFDVIAKPCLWLMNVIHDRAIPNYGVSIIILTILFKLLFWPLGTKSYKSMAEMKKLQPLMEEIRKKYKEDKKKMNEEIMGLYRTYKVNPMSGCLPMLVQIPVFIAFYRMLYGAIELRHAPFALWINDLSSPDRLFHFGFSIPLMAPPYGIPVLTIIMGATMLLQQKLSPPPGDPAQAKMMMMLPIVFTFIFINFPSGLVLYWLVNNVLSIAQQYYITKKTV